ncbi:MAG: PmoA family protein [Candidatus Poribacteria bacterium]|nr:PmoA family protein [Candidatus Poribacteria bacterium]
MSNYEVIVNARTHLVVDTDAGRCLGGVGANFYRPFVFPFYTPAGHTVIQEFAFDHPFHNGIFVGQAPVKVGKREAWFWGAPPRRSFTDRLFEQLGRMETEKEIDIAPHADGVKFVQNIIWRDANEEPLIDEIRTVNLYSIAEGTVCEMTSEKIANYGAVEYPQTKYGSIGMRVEPRLLPVMGGVVIGDNNRRGKVEVIDENTSDFVAYQNQLPGHGHFGVFMTILEEEIRGPWFIRDYGMALYNPTQTGPVSTPANGTWKIALRFVAYDGELTTARAEEWCMV